MRSWGGGAFGGLWFCFVFCLVFVVFVLRDGIGVGCLCFDFVIVDVFDSFACGCLLLGDALVI